MVGSIPVDPRKIEHERRLRSWSVSRLAAESGVAATTLGRLLTQQDAPTVLVSPATAEGIARAFANHEANPDMVVILPDVVERAS